MYTIKYKQIRLNLLIQPLLTAIPNLSEVEKQIMRHFAKKMSNGQNTTYCFQKKQTFLINHYL